MSTSQHQLTDVAEALRVAGGLTHQQFVDALSRDKTEWAHMRARRRGPSDAFVRALRTYAHTVGGIWPSRVDVAIQQDALAKVAA